MKAGQLIIGGFDGATVTQQARDLITKHHVGLMILSSKNFATALQTRELISSLQRLAHESGYVYPILFAVDQEGGMLALLFDERSITQFPGAMALAASGSEDLVFSVSKAVAVELRSLGFSLILGPVLDVVTSMSNQLIGVRAFSKTVEDVVKYGSAAARGLRAGGMMTAGKHFPGIGSATVDSVLELPIMPETLLQIEGMHAVPFARLISAGLLDAVSVAGCAVPNISPEETHACLSPVVINQLLRGKYRFEGVVISECLEMDALYRSYGLSQGVIMAIHAGCDLVIVCHNYALQEEAMASITQAMAYGNGGMGMFRRALARVEVLQRQLPAWNEVFTPPPLPEGLWAAHQQLLREAYERSVTVVRDANNCLPLRKFFTGEGIDLLLLTPLLSELYVGERGEALRKEAGCVAGHASCGLGKGTPEPSGGSLSEPEQGFAGERVFQSLGKALSRSSHVTHTTYTANGLTSLHESLISRARVVVVATAEASRFMFQIGIVKHIAMLCLTAKPLVLLAVASPYDFYYNKNIGSAYIACYDYTENALSQIPAVLYGERTAAGTVPGDVRPRVRKEQRLWFVEDFDLERDWVGIKKLWRDAFATEPLFLPPANLPRFFRWVQILLSSTLLKHFVVRNLSMKTVLGVCFVWANPASKYGSIQVVLVDKARRHQSIGTNLHARAMRYLTDECGIEYVTLGSTFPLQLFPAIPALRQTMRELNGWNPGPVVPFLRLVGWNLTTDISLRYVMTMQNLQEWLIPTKIFRELMLVGVRFDLCRDPEILLPLIRKHYTTGLGLYAEAFRNLHRGVQVIVALEPSRSAVVGGIILFTSRSALAMYYPFLEDLSEEPVGGIVGQFIDSAYSNLTEMFSFGLICTALRYFKTQAVTCCALCEVGEKQVAGVEEFGFRRWREYIQTFEVRHKQQ